MKIKYCYTNNQKINYAQLKLWVQKGLDSIQFCENVIELQLSMVIRIKWLSVSHLSWSAEPDLWPEAAACGRAQQSHAEAPRSDYIL